MTESKSKSATIFFARYPERNKLLWAAMIVILVEAVSFGVFMRKMGFYQDDWVLFDLVLGRNGFIDRVNALWFVAYRTVAMLLYAFVFGMGGLKPLFYQVFLAVQDAAGGILFYLFLCRMLGSRRLALTAAVFAVAYPVRPASHHWLSCTTQGFSQSLILGSMLLHQSWMETKRWGWLVGALATYIVAVTGYEALSLLPFAYGAGIVGLSLNAGNKPRTALLSAAKAIWPYAAALLLCAFWRRVGAPAVFHITDPQQTHITLGGILQTYRDGFNCITWDLVNLCLITVVPLFQYLEDPAILLLIIFCVLVGRLLAAYDGVRAEPGALRTAALITAVGFIGAYLPYAIAGYEPTNVGIMSRINGGGALVGGLALSAVLWGLVDLIPAASPRWAAALPQALLTLILAAFTCTNWYIAVQWAMAWNMQQNILEKVHAKITDLPGPMTILLKGAPEYFNGTAVFYKHWGWDAALRVRTGRKDLHGDILTPWMASGAAGLIDTRMTPPVLVHPYSGLFLYDVEKDLLTRVGK